MPALMLGEIYLKRTPTSVHQILSTSALPSNPSPFLWVWF